MLAVSLIAIGAMLLVFALAYVRRDNRSLLPEIIPVSSWFWSLFFFCLAVFFAVYNQLGLVRTGLIPWIVLNVCCVVFSLLELWRDEWRTRAGQASASWVIELGILIFCSYISFVAVEMPSNPYLTEFYLNGMLTEIILIFILISVLHLFTLRSGMGGPFASIAVFIFGLVEYFVVTFKDTPLMASDVLAVGTAAAVSGDYVYLLNESCIIAFILLCLVVFLLSLTPKPKAQGALPALVSVLCACAIAGATAFSIANISFRSTFRVYVSGWLPLTSYWRQGCISAFVSSIQELTPEIPSGYTREVAEDLIASQARAYDAQHASDERQVAAQAQFEELQPSVVVVMNETFADLSMYEKLHAGYEGPHFFNSMEDGLMKGYLQVSPYGGGTCNSEYEFLTSCSIGFLGVGVYPYMVYDLEGMDNVAAQFKELGYSTYAMHPNRAANWNRNVVYEDLGFDHFLDIFDFVGAERFRGKVSDRATYEKTLELLAENESPQFIFNVTMQNHSGYETGLLPQSMVSHYYVDGEDNPALDEYLALIDESDRALEEFLGELRELDRPIVVVFFGDHQPNIARAYNDQIFASEEHDLAHEQRARESVYMVWANYDVAGWSEQLSAMTSCNYLAPKVMEAIGAPLSDFQKAQLVQSEVIPLLNMMGYQEARGAWHEIDDADPQLNELWIEHYYQMFGDGVRYQVGSGAEGRV